MQTIEILQVASFSAFLNRELLNRFHVYPWFALQDAEREQMLRDHAPSIRAVVTGGQLGVPAYLMAQLPALGLIAVNGVGLDKVDLVESKRRGIRVTITSGVLTNDVADLAVGLMISLLRGIPSADRFVRAGNWPRAEYPLTRKVSGCRFGIIGLGHIGRAIAERLQVFGPVAYHGRSQQAVSYSFVPSPLELASQSDVLILAAAANSSTRHMIGRPVLDALGPRGYLVNIARGALVDELELINALKDRRIAGAALDVFDNEPCVPDTLRDADNVVLTPHVASATAETREAMARSVLANLDAFFSSETLPGAIL